jgi:hypothetical protein
MDVRRNKLAASNPLRPSLDALAEAMLTEPAADGTLRVGNYTLTPTGLIGQAASAAEWEQIGDLLRRLEGGIQWMLADWLIEGEREYGQTYQHVAEVTGYEYGYLRNLVYVSGKLSLRSDKLTFAHHTLVAALEPEQQRAWIEWAEANNASVAQMRKAMKGEPASPAPAVSVLDKQARTWGAEISKMARLVEQLDAKDRARVRERAAWLADYYRQIAEKAR